MWGTYLIGGFLRYRKLLRRESSRQKAALKKAAINEYIKA